MGTSNPATLRMLDATRALTEQTRLVGERFDRETAGMAASLGNALERAALANGRVGRMEREQALTGTPAATPGTDLVLHDDRTTDA